MARSCCGDSSYTGEKLQQESRRKWLILLAAHFNFFMWEGLCKSLGVMLQSIAEQLDTDTWLIGCTIGVMMAARGFAGPFLRVLEGRCRYHHIAIVSGLLAGVGVIGASYAKSVPQLAVCLVLLSGPSYGLMLNTSLVLLGQYFQRMYACANGLAYSGGSLGILAFVHLTQLLLDTYGWRGALLLIGGMQLHLAAVGSLLRSNAPCPSSDHHGAGYASIQTDEVQPSTDDGNPSRDDRSISREPLCTSSTVAKFVQAAGLELFGELSYVALVACFSILCFVNVSWVVYVVPHLTVKGLTPADTALVVSAAGLGIFLGQIGHGVLVDFKLVKGRAVFYLANLVGGLMLLVDPLLARTWPLILSNFFFGVGLGVAVPLSFTMMRDAVGVARMTSAVGWAEMVGGVFRIWTSFFTGWFYDQIGSYDVSFVILGSVNCCAVLILLIEDVYGALQRRRTT